MEWRNSTRSSGYFRNSDSKINLCEWLVVLSLLCLLLQNFHQQEDPGKVYVVHCNILLFSDP
jgi:hypothetical protein